MHPELDTGNCDHSDDAWDDDVSLRDLELSVKDASWPSFRRINRIVPTPDLQKSALSGLCPGRGPATKGLTLVVQMGPERGPAVVIINYGIMIVDRKTCDLFGSGQGLMSENSLKRYIFLENFSTE
jgi:hypothetical protein